MEPPLLALARTRPVVLDGAMGTEIQARDLSPADFQGLVGCNEILVMSRPDVIRDIHRAYLEAGADVIETDSFGANAVVLAEYGLAERVFELNRAAAVLARSAADAAAGKPRFVSGSMGPGTRLPSLGQIEYRELYETYREQAAGLLAGGVDALQVETCQDPLQARAAVLGAVDAMAAAGRKVVLFCLVTFEQTGSLLLGTDAQAVATTLSSLPGVDVLGVNCSTGPDDLRGPVRDLSRMVPQPLAVLPNAGLPETREGRIVYPLAPDAFASRMREFVVEHGVSFVGGCCGTGPGHIAALARAVRDAVVGTRDIRFVPAASSLYHAVPLAQSPAPLIVGERTNANGSREFRNRLQAMDLDGMLAVARDQADEGAHLLDVSLATVGRNEAMDAAAFVARLRTEIRLPLVYDSTDPDAIETALSHWPGRAVVNSVNLEDGGGRLDRVARIARRHGAALVALTIDEDGMARTADRKLDCARRLVDRLVGTHGFSPSDLLLDPLTFTLGSGDAELRHSAVETLEALRRIKAAFPGVFTWLGVSNVSFGLAPAARRILNSVFLGLAVEAGLDAAILNAGKVLPLARIPEKIRRLATDLVLDRNPDALETFLQAVEATPPPRPDEAQAGRSVMDRLFHRVLDGQRMGLEDDLREALQDRPALDIVQGVLLRAMQVVGDRFGAGEMQLPFVLRSAEVIRSAVEFLRPELAQGQAPSRGTLVLATVAGDVHDIGKNLVDILLSNHGFRVVNLGIRQPIDAILAAARTERADAIGMSGLLVRSVLVMRDNLMEMRRRGLAIPVLLGGAALDRRHVEQDLAPLYPGPVRYCADAFEAARVLDQIAAGESREALPDRPRPAARTGPVHPLPRPSRISPPVPRYWGARVDAEVPLAEVLPYLDRPFLFRGQWQYRGLGDQREAFERDRLEPLLSRLLDRWGSVIRPAAIRGIVPAGARGEEIRAFSAGGDEVARFRFPLRQGRSIADFFLEAPDGEKPADVLGFLVVTVGPGVSDAGRTLFDSGAFEEYFHLHGLGVAIAEATAEWAHARLREELGLEERLDPTEVLRNQYRGRRYSFGYPGCPGLEDQPVLLALAGAERIGVTLTESFQMVPEQSVSAIVVHHPEAGAGR